LTDAATNQPGILILGGSTDQLFMLETARKMGLRTACLDANPAAPGLARAEVGAAIDFSDLPAVCRWIDQQKIGLNGVCSMGSDVPHLLAAIGDRYNWPAPTAATGALTTDKLAMKACFEANGVATPRFASVQTAGDVAQHWDAWGCQKVIIKPTDRAGSRGVRLLAETSEIAAAVAHAQDQGRCGQLILEEFVPGLQISTETVVAGGQARTPGFADRVYEGMAGFHPQIMENGGWLPSRHRGQPLADQVIELVERAATALGITDGPAKGDVVVCPRRGPMMIEMAARLSGGDFCESLVPLSSGVNYVRTVLEIALGRRPDWSTLVPTTDRVVANRYFFPPAGASKRWIFPPRSARCRESSKWF